MTNEDKKAVFLVALHGLLITPNELAFTGTPGEGSNYFIGYAMKYVERCEELEIFND